MLDLEKQIKELEKQQTLTKMKLSRLKKLQKNANLVSAVEKEQEEIRKIEEEKNKIKYEILFDLPQTYTFGEYQKTVYPIRALKNFADVKKDEIGGFVSGEDNLSQAGECWIYFGGIAMENARVEQNAKVKKGAVVSGSALVTGNSVLENNVHIRKNAEVYGANIKNNVCVTGKAIVEEGAQIENNVFIDRLVRIGKNARVNNFTVFSGWIDIGDGAEISSTRLTDDFVSSIIGENAVVKNSIAPGLNIKAGGRVNGLYKASPGVAIVDKKSTTTLGWDMDMPKEEYRKYVAEKIKSHREFVKAVCENHIYVPNVEALQYLTHSASLTLGGN